MKEVKVMDAETITFAKELISERVEAKERCSHLLLLLGILLKVIDYGFNIVIL